MIPPVEERQVRPCFDYKDDNACIFAVADDQAETCSMLEWFGGEPTQWHTRISELRQPKCKYHITHAEMRELIDSGGIL